MWKNYSNQKLKNVSYTNPNYKNKTSIIQEIKIQQQKKHLMTTHLLINRVLVVVWKTKLRIPIHYYFYTFRPVWREKNSTNGIVIECAISKQDQKYLRSSNLLRLINLHRQYFKNTSTKQYKYKRKTSSDFHFYNITFLFFDNLENS